MLIHFLNNYKVLGRVGDRIRIKGSFPGISVDDYVYLGNGEEEDSEEMTFRIERIDDYDEINNQFGAVIVRG